MSITIDELEQLARQFQEEDTHQREHLRRLIKAYAGIVDAKATEHFKRHACRYADSDASDGSFPPEQEYEEFSGPRLVEVSDSAWSAKKHSSTFYYDFDFFTKDRGLYVDPNGDIFGCEWGGTGRFGSFPARPGYCAVDATLTWVSLCADDISLADLSAIEEHMRTLAHPHIEQALAS